MGTFYKIHGYLSRQEGMNRNFKVANNARGEQESQDEVPPCSPVLPRRNLEQSKQLLQFLANLTVGNEQKQSVSKATM